jgi:hypothetical protein
LSVFLLALALIGPTTTMIGVAAVAVFLGISDFALYLRLSVAIVVAILYAGWLGIDLNDYSTFHGDMQMAATLSLTGLALLICGMRLAPARPNRKTRSLRAWRLVDLKRKTGSGELPAERGT